MVTGGSRGIGLATAEALARCGANLCLVARDAHVLEEARRAVERARGRSEQFVEAIACDCTAADALRPLLEGFVARRGAPYLLVNCVGAARPAYARQAVLSDFREHIEANYFSQLTPLLLLLPHLLAAGRGHVVNVSSLLGFMSVVGYAAYSPAKYALAGLTEALRHELKPFGVGFSIVYPPDVDTPGYAAENRTKPPECADLSRRARIMTAEAVARDIIVGVARRRYEITPGESAFVWRMFRHFPSLVRGSIDREYRQALRRRAAGQSEAGTRA